MLVPWAPTAQPQGRRRALCAQQARTLPQRRQLRVRYVGWVRTVQQQGHQYVGHVRSLYMREQQHAIQVQQ